jgi:hypothetical protein
MTSGATVDFATGFLVEKSGTRCDFFFIESSVRAFAPGRVPRDELGDEPSPALRRSVISERTVSAGLV